MDTSSGKQVGEKRIFPRGGALLFALLRLASCLVLIAGIVFAFSLSWFFSGMQGFSPDGAPPGFRPIPTPLFALLFTPYFLLLLALGFPWLSIPALAGVGSEIIWRACSRDVRFRWNAALTRYSARVVGGYALVFFGWIAGCLYVYRTGEAEFCVQNHSSRTLDHVEWQAETGTIDLGQMLPLERRFCRFLPKSAREKVHLAFTVDGVAHRVDFTGGVENSRKYYYQFAVSEDLRGEYGAWEFPWMMCTSVAVYNDSLRELSNVEINGLGWQISAPTLAPKQSMNDVVLPKGPLIYAMSFEVDGKRHAYNLWEGSGKEGDITVRIPAASNGTALDKWQPSSN